MCGEFIWNTNMYFTLFLDLHMARTLYSPYLILIIWDYFISRAEMSWLLSWSLNITDEYG